MKNFLISLIIFLSFFSISSVKAEELTGLSIPEVARCPNDTCLYPTPQTHNYSTRVFYGFYGDGYLSRSIFLVRGFHNKLNPSKSYTVSFWIFFSNATYGTYPDLNSNVYPPLVQLDDRACYVRPYGSTQVTGVYNYQYVYNVLCDSFVPKNNEYNVSVLTVPSETIKDGFYGITKDWNFWENDTQLGQVIESNEDIKDSVNDLNDNITSSDTSDSQNNANSFFEGFKTDDYGLSDIINMPLSLIKSLTSSTCVSLKLTVPWVNKQLELPCMSSIYSKYFGSFFTLYQTVTFGFVSYWVVVRIFALVKSFKDPDNDKVEVMDL